MKKYAKKLLLMLLMLGMLVTVLPADTFAEGKTTSFLPNITIKTLRGKYLDIPGSKLAVKNNETGEVYEYTTIPERNNHRHIPRGEYTISLISLPENSDVLKGRVYELPKDKVVKVSGFSQYAGIELVEIVINPTVEDEVLEVGGKVNLTDNVSNLKDLPEGTKVEDVTEEGNIDTNTPGEYIGKIKITWSDNLAMIKEVKVIVKGDVNKYDPIIEDEVIEKGGKVDLKDNVTNLKDLPAGTKVEDITEDGAINTNVPGEYTGKIKITYPDGSSLIKEVRVVVKGDVNKYDPIISDEVVEKGGKIDLTDNVSNLKDLPQGTKVEDITEAGKINTNVPGEYTGKIKITYPDGSSLIKEVKVIVKDNHEDGPVIDNGGNIVSTRNNRRPLFPWLELGKYESYGNEASKEVPKEDKKEILTHIAYIKGYPDGTVKADGNVTRAEAVTMLVRLKGYNVAVANNDLYADVKSGDWFSPYIDAAYKAGILEEKTGENFRPNEAITRAELAQLISHVDNKNDAKSSFADAKGHKFEKAIDQAYGNKRIEGYEDGTFRPDNKITRAEIAKILNSLFDRKVNQEGLNDLYIDTFKDLNKGHWGYYDILEASLGHEFFKDGNSNEEWTKLIK